MTNWRYKIKLNEVLERIAEEHDLSRHEEPCPEEVLNALAEECEKAVPLHHFGQRFRDAKSIAEARRILEDVYDVADKRLVWCGL